MTRLYIEDEAGNVQVLPFDDPEITVGRATDNKIVIPDRNVSRRHARLRQSSNRFWVVDAGARYGLKIASGKVTGETEIRPGDFVFVGDYKLKILPPEGVAEDAMRPVAELDKPEPARKPVEAPAAAPAKAPAPALWDDDDEAVKGTGKNFKNVLLLAVLVALAVGLAIVYVMLSSDTIPETTAAAVAPAATTTTSAAKPKVEPAAPAVEPEDEPEDEPAAAPAAATGETPRAKAAPTKAAPAEPHKTETKVASIEKKPAAAPEKPTPAPAPAPAPAAAADDLLARIDAALGSGDATGAEALLNGCKGSACLSKWKKLANIYKGRGSSAKAIEILKKMVRMTGDAQQKERLKLEIEALGGSVD